MHRVWLNWSEPCLPAAAEWLIDRHHEADRCDLRNMVCVMPGSRAGRLLLELLLRRCEKRRLRFTPPRIVTPGALAAELLPQDQPTADENESILVWVEAIRSCPRRNVRLLLPAEPGEDDLPAWCELARTFASIHDELAGWEVDFTEVAETAERREMFAEGDRWRALAAVFELYREHLRRLGLWEKHDAQAAALKEYSIDPECEVILVGVAELNARQRTLLRKLGRQAIALVHAPEELCDRFDECGCVRPDAWTEVRIGLSDNQIAAADRPEDQAQAALRPIADLEGGCGPDEITIGLGDEELSETLVRAGRWAGVNLHSASGIALSRTAPYRFLAAVADWLDEPRFANFAALLRHPDIENALFPQSPVKEAEHETHLNAGGEGTSGGGGEGTSGGGGGGVSDWLSLLDRYFTDHLHQRLAGRWLGEPDRARRMRAVYQAMVTDLLGPLSGPARSLAEWGRPIIAVLQMVYSSSPGISISATTMEACRLLRDALASWARIATELQPTVNAEGALRLLLTDTSGLPLPSPARRDQIEMLGWLELHLDTAPVLIITGCNDGNIPRAVSGDPFLPDTLRDTLGMSCNRTRYGRDAYLLEAIRHSRDQLTIVAGRRSANDDPLSPSRLLLACDDETLLKRVRRLCDEATEMDRPLPIGAAGIGEASRFVIPPIPDHLSAPPYMRVTDFRLYLQCPYRYALSRLIGLESVSDAGRELDPLQFGILAHEVLQAFGLDEAIRNSDDAEAIEKYLLRELKRQSKKRFGGEPMPAVRLQLARLAQRLSEFARHQAKMRAEGWMIEHTELDLSKGSRLEVPGQEPMPIHGKIDRIDHHPPTGRRRIIDYKTGETGHSPFKAHHDRETLPADGALHWIDLQLPLYHHLAEQHGITGDIELAYIVLPKKAENAGLKLANWRGEHLESAIETAREVVRGIRAGQFQINEEYHSTFDEFARICQSSAFAEGNGETANGGESES